MATDRERDLPNIIVMRFKIILSVLIFTQFIALAATKTTTATVGTWTPAGNPAIGDDVVVNHDWSAGWLIAGGLSNGFTGTITVNDGGYFRGTNAMANFSGTMTIANGGFFEIDGDMTNFSGAIVVDAGAVFRSNWNFDAGDDASGASLTVNGSFYMSASLPQGVLTLDLVVGGTGNIHAASIVLNGNGSTGVTALPVELTSFVAESTEVGVVLNWTTSSEINNDFFDIEKSTDGKNFISIGTVLGNGNSSDQIDYAFVDQEGGNQNTYYRLKQVDFDGAVNYSHVVTTGSSNKSFEIVQKGSSSEFYILTAEPTHLTIEVYDLTGRKVFENIFNGTKGGRFNFDVQQQGNYVVIAKSASEIVSKKSIIH